jgi:ABC-2 type transport system permease protein
MQTLRSSLWLAGRSLLLVRRLPSVFIPAMVMPLFILIATAGAFHANGNLPGFAGISYLRFTIPMAATMGAGFAGINAGMTLARDVEGGFFSRLTATPIPRLALLGGPGLAAVARSLFTTTVVLTVAAMGSIGLPGFWGTVVVYLFSAAFSMIAALWSMGVALRARSMQSVPLMQVVIFVSVFLSVAYTPRELMRGWLRHAADWNPVTRIMETSRAAEAGTLAWANLWPGLLAIAVLLLVLGTFALRGLQSAVRDA